MLIKVIKGWERAEREVTPEGLRLRRRGLLAAVAGVALAGQIRPARAAINEDPPVSALYPPGRPLTAERAATTYNNFYEFSEGKDLWRAAQKMPQSPWSVTLDGLVDRPLTVDLDMLASMVTLQQRVYRHRCVEAWAMTVPWTGVPLADIIKLASPKPSAKYVMFTTAQLPKYMPGLEEPFYPWPYTEGLTLAEANNDLAMIVTGMYGKALPPQDGGPIRLVVPWKYGFKSAKSLVKITFTETMPNTFWSEIGPSEYGFWANVNPAVPHPRWSQASERLLGTGEIVPTQIYNGYAEWVAPLYSGMTGIQLFR